MSIAPVFSCEHTWMVCLWSWRNRGHQKSRKPLPLHGASAHPVLKVKKNKQNLTNRNLKKIAMNEWYIEDITWLHGDTKFLFSCWKIFHSFAALSREIFFQHEKRNFVSPSSHVMFYLLYKHQWTTKPFLFNSFLVWKELFIMKP